METEFKINSLSFISSVTCNLNCSFCYLNKNQSYHEFDKLVHQAWQDGSYLQNVLNTLEALEIDKTQVEIIQLWGGEVLLRIDDVSKNIPAIYKHFPRINSWKVSTNWLIDIDKVFEFIKIIDNNAKRKTEVDIQVSIDGPPGPITDSGHHGNWDTYRKNFKKFTNLVNNYKFKNTKIEMHINATVNKDLYLSTFADYQQVKDYMQYMGDFATEINNMCISESFMYYQTLIYPGYATPYKDTAADGRKLAEIFRLWDQVYQNEFKNKYPFELGFFVGIGNFSTNKNLFEKNMECAELMHALTINYDGSICECSGSYIDYFEPYLTELKEKGQMDDYWTSIAHNKMTSYNPSHMDKIDIERHKWAIHNGGYRHTYSTYLHMLFSLAEALLDAGQISQKYATDKDLLLKHCLLMLNCISCSRNNVIGTHVPYLTPVAALRRYLNGAMDYVYEKGLQTTYGEMKQRLKGAGGKN